MDWLNLHTSVLDSPECLRCDPVRRATWIWLLRYCIGQENGGLIEDCRDWGDTTWQQLCRVRLEEVDTKSALWTWEVNNLRVKHYPLEKEQEVKRNRLHGKAGGQARTQAKAQAARANGYQQEAKQNPTPQPTEGKGREEEGEGKSTAPTPPGLFDDMDKDQIEIAQAMPVDPNWLDWRMLHPLVRVGRRGDDGDATAWEKLFGYYGQECFNTAYRILVRDAPKPDSPIYYDQLAKWLHLNTEAPNAPKA